MFKKMMKHLINNPGLKILSAVIAVLLWLVVVNVENPQISDNFAVPIEFINEDMVANMGKVYEVVGHEDSSEPIFVNITVTGPRKTMESLTAASFTATVDLAQVEGFEREGEEFVLTCSGRAPRGLKVSEDGLLRHLVALERPALAQPMPEQLSLFGP